MTERDQQHKVSLSELAGPFGEAPRDRLVRESFLLGFIVLLSLVLALGTISIYRVRTIEEEITARATRNKSHQEIVLELKDETGRLATLVTLFEMARAFGATTAPTRHKIEQLDGEIAKTLDRGRASRMGSWPEWAAIEQSYAAYEAALGESLRSPGMQPAPQEIATAYANAVDAARDRVRAESAEAEIEAREQRTRAQRDIILATAACLGVGLFVSIVSFVETRRRIALIRDAYRRVAHGKELIESTLEGINSAVITIGLDGLATGINGEALRLFGIDSADRVVGRPVEEALGRHPKLLAKVAASITSPESSRRYLGRLEVGTRRGLYDVYAAPLVIAGEARGSIVTLADVTEAERSASELRRNRALMAVGQMTAQVAHEIKNPLGGVRLAAQMLGRLHKNDEQSLEMVRRIESSVDHLSRIVAELNQFARPRELSLEEVRLDALVDELLEMVWDRVEAKHVTVDREYDPRLTAAFLDAGELKKALINFLVNALEASPEGARLVVTIEVIDPEGDSVRLVVRDEGHGMDDETIGRLFEPFFTTKASGTGLGMSIALKIIEQHKGTLDVQSVVGEGTTIVVTLPLTLAPAPEPAAPGPAGKESA
jgi:signal transduction histidine kinase